MDRNFKYFISTLGSRNQLFIIKACKDINKKSTIEEEIIKICESEIKDDEQDELKILGGVIYKEPATSENFLKSIKDSNTKNLLFLKLIFRCAYFDSLNDEYRIVCDYIDLIIELRKKIVTLITNHIGKLSDSDQDYYINLLPKEILEQLSKYFEVKVEDITPRVLKRI